MFSSDLLQQCLTQKSDIVTEQPGRYLDNILSERRKRRRRLGKDSFCRREDMMMEILTSYLRSS